MDIADAMDVLGRYVGESETRQKVFRESWDRMWNHLFKLEDTDLIILKGHLVVEHELKVMVGHKVLNPEELKRFGFSQYLTLAKALYEPPKDAPWAWSAIEKLNQLRNVIAHELDSERYEAKVREFCSVFPRAQGAPEYTVKDCVLHTYSICLWFSLDHL